MAEQAVTLTFGNRGENHAGMQVIGRRLESGLSLPELHTLYREASNRGAECLLYDLTRLLPEARRTGAPPAQLLVIKRGVEVLLRPGGADALLAEQNTLEKDKQAWMRGRAVTKRARHNLCFADFAQTADFAQKKGTVADFTTVPGLARLRAQISGLLETPKLRDLICEGNYYYDPRKTYIGWHGDSEREVVVAARLGVDFPLFYRWYERHETLGEIFRVVLSHGDMYVMSDKAVGHDWKRSSILTLRHAAGPETLLL